MPDDYEFRLLLAVIALAAYLRVRIEWLRGKNPSDRATAEDKNEHKKACWRWIHRLTLVEMQCIFWGVLLAWRICGPPIRLPYPVWLDYGILGGFLLLILHLSVLHAIQWTRDLQQRSD